MRTNILKTFTWPTAVLILAGTILMGCKGSKQNRHVEDEEETMEMADEKVSDDGEKPAEQDAQQAEEVNVINARDFIMALKDNARINVITNDPLNITNAITQLIDEGKLERYYIDGEPRKDHGVFWEPVYDGNTIIVNGLSNINIRGAHDDDAFLIASPRYADVLCFVDCQNVVIDNFILGHEDTGDCVGDVLVLQKCKNIEVSNCSLFGCGVNGLTLDNATNITVSKTKIYGCSNWGVMIADAKNVTMKECEIYNNGMGVTANESCENVIFDKCKFYSNKGMLFSCGSEIKVTNSEIEHHHDDFLENVKVTNSKVLMDYSEAGELPDIEHE
ncbi:MAG: right-handed parallel beta-helix repeat-containing protein [Prevotella sp.]|nr:right-handed parallel beta-helix repeat-containing protein [Prevotella sp.]